MKELREAQVRKSPSSGIHGMPQEQEYWDFCAGETLYCNLSSST